MKWTPEHQICVEDNIVDVHVPLMQKIKTYIRDKVCTKKCPSCRSAKLSTDCFQRAATCKINIFDKQLGRSRN